jgi:hypothetical protein
MGDDDRPGFLPTESECCVTPIVNYRSGIDGASDMPRTRLYHRCQSGHSLGRDVGGSPRTARPMRCNYRAEAMALDVWRFDGSGVGDVQKRPKVFVRRHAPKRLTVSAPIAAHDTEIISTPDRVRRRSRTAQGL